MEAHLTPPHLRSTQLSSTRLITSLNNAATLRIGGVIICEHLYSTQHVTTRLNLESASANGALLHSLLYARW